MFVGEPPTTPISVGSNLLQSVENFQLRLQPVWYWRWHTSETR